MPDSLSSLSIDSNHSVVSYERNVFENQRSTSTPNMLTYDIHLGLQSPFLASWTVWIIATLSEEISPVCEFALTLLSNVSYDHLKLGGKSHTVQQKQFSCHSAPRAVTTVSVTGLRHFLHLVEKRFVWQLIHHAYPSFST
jgi:hypothetical protein